MILDKLFGPAEVPPAFAGFPKEMALRPSQLRAAAAESALMIPDAMAMQSAYPGITQPVAIVAGDGDRIVDTGRQSQRLHAALPHSTLHVAGRTGHMVHHTATDLVLAAIDEVAGARGSLPAGSRAKRPELAA
jgi:pimeloyl-ACP methyl ester carboxylesterase